MTISSSEVSGIIVTRGDVELDAIRESLPFEDLVIWNNAKAYRDLGVLGRYAALALVRNSIVCVQDDDCLIPDVPALLDEYEPGVVVANMPVSRWPDYPDSCLVGWGAVFDRDLPYRAFSRWAAYHALPWSESFFDERFRRDCDVVFTTLTPHRKVDLGFQHLPWAETPERLFKQPEHTAARERMLDRAREVRDG